MAGSAFVYVEYSKELEEKIRGMPGVIPKESFDGAGFWRVKVPAELFHQHKKECDAHKWIRIEGGLFLHYDPLLHPGNWEYCSHGFEVWFNFNGDMVFVIPHHWNCGHGHLTLIDISEWIKDNLGDIRIKREDVS